jgi:hypothetical protein
MVYIVPDRNEFYCIFECQKGRREAAGAAKRSAVTAKRAAPKAVEATPKAVTGKRAAPKAGVAAAKATVAAPKAAAAGRAAKASAARMPTGSIKSKPSGKPRVSAARRAKPLTAAKPKGGKKPEELQPCIGFKVAKDSLPGFPALAPYAIASIAAGAVIPCAPLALTTVPPFVSVRVVDERGIYLPLPYAEYGTADVATAAILAVGGAGALGAVQACPRLTTTALIMFGDGTNQKVLRGVPHPKVLLQHWKDRRAPSE